MRRGGWRLAAVLGVALGVAGAGCGGAPNAQAVAPSGITAQSFTTTYAVMARFRPLASAGRGSVGVLLPDEGPLDPNAALDAASLVKAFQSAGLDASQYRVDNAQRPRRHPGAPRPVPTSRRGRRC